MAQRTDTTRLATDARTIFDAAVAGVAAERLLARVPWPSLVGARTLDSFARIDVLGVGKGAIPMTRVALHALAAHVPADRIRASVTVPRGWEGGLTLRCERFDAGHPIPDEGSVRAARHALDVATAADEDTLVLVLLTGGASALWTAPADGLTLDDLRATTDALLRGGATIAELNTARKHLSAISGGRLAVAGHPATVCALIVSDVVGDDPSVIGSGPTVGDASTFGDALEVIVTRGAARVPDAVRAHLEHGARGDVDETPKPSDPRFARAETHVVGTNGDALEAAARAADALGFRVEVDRAPVVGEARDAGASLALRARALAASPERRCLIVGGETTVRVSGSGRGGRNQEIALSAALTLDRDPPTGALVVLSAGTDGIDGPTNAAGACVDAASADAMRAAGIDPAARLSNNDAYPALDAIGALIRTGATHVNVMDVQIVVTAPSR